MFIATLFTVDKIWKQLKYPPIDEWIRKIGDATYNGILYSHKKDEIMLPLIWMDLDNTMLSEISQIEKDKYQDFTNM